MTTILRSPPTERGSDNPDLIADVDVVAAYSPALM